MAREVDQHVVQMVFDNDKFEANAKETMSTLDKLKEKLGFGDTSTGFDKLEESIDKVDLSHLEGGVDRLTERFSTLGTIGMAALQNITNKAIQAGEQLINAMIFDAPKAGFAEYELQANTIQTIMSGTGEKLDTVKKKLNELNEYADQTIYVFSDMTRNISKFTNQGINLDTSVAAIKGISNVAALAGANAEQASHAMYNFAQALGSGYVKLIDWKSIQNATMDTKEFKEALIQVAGQMGTITKKADGTYSILKQKTKGTGKNAKTVTEEIQVNIGTFMDTLKEGWLTNEVLLKTLGIFSGDVSEELLKSMKFTDDQIRDFMELAAKAQDAATQIKTATQLFDTLREALGTGWAKTFEWILGDFEEAKGLFTAIGNVLNGEIGRMSDARNKFFEQWHTAQVGVKLDPETGAYIPVTAYEHFRETLVGIIEVALRLKNAISRGFEDSLFFGTTATSLVNFTESIRVAVLGMNNALTSTADGGIWNKIKVISGGIGSVIRLASVFFSYVWSWVVDLWGQLSPFFKYIIDILYVVSEDLRKLSQDTAFANKLKDVFGKLSDILRPLTAILARFGKKLYDAFMAFRKWATDNKVLEKVLDGLSVGLTIISYAVAILANVAVTAWVKIKKFFKGLYDGAKQWLKPATEWITAKFKKVQELAGQIGKGDYSGVEKIFDGLKDKFNTAVEDVKTWFKETFLENPVVKAIAEFFAPITNALSSIFTKKTWTVGKYTFTDNDDDPWWKKLEDHFNSGVENVEAFFNKFKENPIVAKVTEFFGAVWDSVKGFFSPSEFAEDERGYPSSYKKNGGATGISLWWKNITESIDNGIKNVEAFFNKFKENPVVAKVKEFFDGMWSAVKGFFSPSEFGEDERGYPSSYKKTGATGASLWWTSITSKVQTGINNVKAIIEQYIKDNPVVTVVRNFFSGIWETVINFFKGDETVDGVTPVSESDNTWWSNITKKIEGGISSVEVFFDKYIGKNPVVAKVKEFFDGMWSAVKGFFSPSEFGEDERGYPSSYKKTGATGASLWWTSITSKVQTGINNVKAIIEQYIKDNPVVTVVRNFFSGIWETVINFFKGDETVDGVTPVSESDNTWWNKITESITTGIDEVNKFFDLYVTNNPVVAKVKEFFDGMWRSVKSFFSPSEFGEDERGYPSSYKKTGATGASLWWSHITSRVQEGIDLVEGFFTQYVAENPVVTAVSGFFSGLWTEVSGWFSGEKKGDGVSEESENKGKNWWVIVKGKINAGLAVITEFFADVADNPVVSLVAEWFSNMWSGINGWFRGDNSGETETEAKTPWWEVVKTKVQSGVKTLTEWFNEQREKSPLLDSVAGFFSRVWNSITDFFHTDVIVKTQEKISGNTDDFETVTTIPWYQKLINIFQNGFQSVKSWFEEQKEKNPIFAAISTFFTSIWTTVSTAVTNLLTKKEEGSGGAGEGETWWQKILGWFTTGFENIKFQLEYWTKNNPLGQSLSGLFGGLWGTIMNLVSPGSNPEAAQQMSDGLVGVLSSATSALNRWTVSLGGTAGKAKTTQEAMQNAMAVFKETPRIQQQSMLEKGLMWTMDFMFGGGSALGESEREGAAENIMSALDQAGEISDKAKEVAPPSSGSPVIDAFSAFISALADIFVVLWEKVNNFLGRFSFDNLWNFLDKIFGYIKELDLFFGLKTISNLAEIAAAKFRTDTWEAVSKIFMSLASIGLVAMTFAEIDNEKSTKGLLFIGLLIGGLLGTIGMLALLTKVQSKTGTTLTLSTALIGTGTTLEKLAGALANSSIFVAVGSLAESITDSFSKIMEITKSRSGEDVWSAIGYFFALVFGFGIIVFALAGIGNLLSGKGIGTAFDLIAQCTQASSTLFPGMTGSSMSTALSTFTDGSIANALSGSGMSNVFEFSAKGNSLILEMIEAAAAMWMMVDTLDKLKVFVKKYDIKSVDDLKPELDILKGIFEAVIIGGGVVSLVGGVSDRIAGPNANSNNIQNGVGEAVEIAGALLSMALAVQILVTSLEKIVDITSKVTEDPSVMSSALETLEELMSAVFQADIMERLLNLGAQFTFSKQGISMKDLQNLSGNALGALLSNPIIALAGAVYVLVLALDKMVSIRDKYINDPGKITEAIEDIKTFLFDIVLSETTINVLSGKAGFAGGGSALLTGASIIAGIITMVTQFESLLAFSKEYTADDMREVGETLNELLGAFVSAMAITEIFSVFAEGMSWKGLAFTALISAIIGLAAWGSVQIFKEFANSIKNDFTPAVQDLIGSITSLPGADVDKITNVVGAISSLAEATAEYTGVAGGWLNAVFTSVFRDLGAIDGLEELAVETEKFTGHLPNIKEDITGLGNQAADFAVFTDFVYRMAAASWFVSGSSIKEFETIGSTFEVLSGQVNTIVTNLSGKNDEDYAHAILAFDFLRRITEIAKYMRQNNIQNVGSDTLTGISEMINWLVDDPEMLQNLGLIGSYIAEGFVGNSDAILFDVDRLLTEITTKTTNFKSDMEQAGINFVEGFVTGMTSNDQLIAVGDAGALLGKTAKEHLLLAIDSNSPSKETFKAGQYFSQGFSLGIQEDGDLAKRSASEMAEGSIIAMRDSLSGRLASELDDNFLVLTPVIDMSEIQNGMGELEGYASRQWGFGKWTPAMDASGLAGASNYKLGAYAGYSVSGYLNNYPDVAAGVFDATPIMGQIAGLQDQIASLSGDISNMQLVIDSDLLVGGISRKMNRALGQIAIREERRG